MLNVKEALLLLMDSINESEEYRNYIREREKIKQNPELKARIDGFRQRNFEIQTNGDTDYDAVDQIKSEYADFLDEPLVNDFLSAELVFCRMMREIIMDISGTIDLDFE